MAKKKTNSSKSKTVSLEIEKVYEQTGIPDPNDDRGSEWLSDYCHDSARSFVEEWAKDNELDEAPQDVYDAVLYKIEETAGKDMWEHQRSWLLEAIEYSAQKAMASTDAPGAIDSVDEDKGIVSVTIHKPFLKVWEQATTGQGYSAWGGDERLADVNMGHVLQILDDIADVYGNGGSIKACYQSTVDDRFQPETGNYNQLVKVADEAYKEVVAAEKKNQRQIDKMMRT